MDSLFEALSVILLGVGFGHLLVLFMFLITHFYEEPFSLSIILINGLIDSFLGITAFYISNKREHSSKKLLEIKEYG